MKKKLKLIINFIIIILFIFSAKSYASSYEEVHEAFQEVVKAYYMHGANIQYTTRKSSFFAPEDATSQNLKYLVCSTFAKNVYHELLELEVDDIPTWTNDWLNRGTKINEPQPEANASEVIAYGYRDDESNLIMKI